MVTVAKQWVIGPADAPRPDLAWPTAMAARSARHETPYVDPPCVPRPPYLVSTRVVVDGVEMDLRDLLERDVRIERLAETVTP